MSKKGLFGIIAAIIVLATAAVVLLMPSNEPKDTSKAETKSSATKRVACVTANNPAATMDPDVRSALELTVMGERPTVRAGTQADIFVDEYTGKKATGSILYGGGYGSNSFTATKSGNDWKVTEFNECAS